MWIPIWWQKENTGLEPPCSDLMYFSASRCQIQAHVPKSTNGSKPDFTCSALQYSSWCVVGLETLPPCGQIVNKIKVENKTKENFPPVTLMMKLVNLNIVVVVICLIDVFMTQNHKTTHFIFEY